MQENAITVQTTIQAPIQKVWDYFSIPEHIMNWCFASDDWHCPASVNDLQVGGKFSSTMAAKDGSFSFDFGGVYDEVEHLQKMKYTLEDGRQVEIIFNQTGNETTVTETFDPENMNPLEMQQAGWQAILDNFKKYVESSN